MASRLNTIFLGVIAAAALGAAAGLAWWGWVGWQTAQLRSAAIPPPDQQAQSQPDHLDECRNYVAAWESGDSAARGGIVRRFGAETEAVLGSCRTIIQLSDP